MYALPDSYPMWRHLMQRHSGDRQIHSHYFRIKIVRLHLSKCYWLIHQSTKRWAMLFWVAYAFSCGHDFMLCTLWLSQSSPFLLILSWNKVHHHWDFHRRLSRNESALMDPQGRILLEQSHVALENTKYLRGRELEREAGVYVGVMHMEYIQYLAGLYSINGFLSSFAKWLVPIKRKAMSIMT